MRLGGPVMVNEARHSSRTTVDVGGLEFVPLPLPPPPRDAIAAYENLVASIEGVRSAYLVPGLLPGAMETPTHVLLVALDAIGAAENLRASVGAQLGSDDWAYERYPLMPVAEGDPLLIGGPQFGIKLGRRRAGLIGTKWEGFDGTIPSVPQPQVIWATEARRISDLFEVEPSGGETTPAHVEIPPGHIVRTYSASPHCQRSRLVYPMWLIDVGAEGDIDRAITLASELLAFDCNAVLTWVTNPLAMRRWSSETTPRWLQRLGAFDDERGFRGNIVIYDTGDDAHKSIQRAHEMGFPLVLPTLNAPYFIEVLRPSGWAAACAARTLEPEDGLPAPRT